MKTLPDQIRQTKRLSKELGIDIFNCPLFIHEDYSFVPDLYTSNTQNIDKDYSTLNDIPMPFTEFRVIAGFSVDQLRIPATGKTIRNVRQKSFIYVKRDGDTLSAIVQPLITDGVRHSAEYTEYIKLRRVHEIVPTSVSFLVKPHPHADRKAFVEITAYSGDSGKVTFTPVDEQHRYRCGVSDYDDVQWISSGNNRLIELLSHSSIALSCIGNLVKTASSHNKRIVEVCPSLNAPEMEWLQGRKHFVILSNREAAERSADSEAFKVKACEPITRMAHARRAHLRVLRSPKFRHKMGKRIFVKETWVGPKEWMDKSQSTYKVLLN